MGRSPNWYLELVAQVCAESEKVSLDSERRPWRVCPFTASWHESKRLSCDACIGRVCQRFEEVGLDEKAQPLPKRNRPRCGAKTRNSRLCQAPVIPGKRRCRLHGGASTGPRTSQGRERIAEAQRRRWQKYHASRQ